MRLREGAAQKSTGLLGRHAPGTRLVRWRGLFDIVNFQMLLGRALRL